VKRTQQEVVDAYPGHLKKVGNEWTGPCPVCGGTDRFFVKPNGTFHCRQNLGDKAHWKTLATVLGFARDRRPIKTGWADIKVTRALKQASGARIDMDLADAAEATASDTPTAIAKTRKNADAIMTHTRLTLESAEAHGRKPLVSLDPDGLAAALAHVGIRVRRNVRGSLEEFREENDEKWTEIQRYDVSHWRTKRIPQACVCQKPKANDFIVVPAVFGRDNFRDYLLAVLKERSVDPFRDYLAELPDWDKTPRIDHWLGDCFDVANSDLTRWASRYVFLGSITRTFRPGAKLDETPVLIGPKGCGKSTAVRRWLPDDEWFGDAVTFRQSTKEQAEAMQGKVIVEIAEMSGSTRAEVEALKAFMTRTKEQVRLAYGRQVHRQPRMCIFIGTANPGTPIPDDDAASRRFVTVTVAIGQDGVAGLRSYQDRNRDQCWAEALKRFGSGEEARLPEHLFPQQHATNDLFRNRDPLFEEAVEDSVGIVGNEGPFTMADMVDQMLKLSPGIIDKRRDSKRLGVALRRLGYESRLRRWPEWGGKRKRAWCKEAK